MDYLQICNLGQAFGLAFKITTFCISVPWFKSQLSFPLMYTWKAACNGSSGCIPASHMGNQEWVPNSQLWPDLASSYCGCWRTKHQMGTICVLRLFHIFQAMLNIFIIAALTSSIISPSLSVLSLSVDWFIMGVGYVSMLIYVSNNVFIGAGHCADHVVVFCSFLSFLQECSVPVCSPLAFRWVWSF